MKFRPSLKRGNRVLDERGLTATIIKLDDPDRPIIAHLLYDYQCPNSTPKPKPVGLLTFVSSR